MTHSVERTRIYRARKSGKERALCPLLSANILCLGNLAAVQRGRLVAGEGIDGLLRDRARQSDGLADRKVARDLAVHRRLVPTALSVLHGDVGEGSVVPGNLARELRDREGEEQAILDLPVVLLRCLNGLLSLLSLCASVDGRKGSDDVHDVLSDRIAVVALARGKEIDAIVAHVLTDLATLVGADPLDALIGGIVVGIGGNLCIRVLAGRDDGRLGSLARRDAAVVVDVIAAHVTPVLADLHIHERDPLGEKELLGRATGRAAPSAAKLAEEIVDVLHLLGMGLRRLDARVIRQTGRANLLDLTVIVTHQEGRVTDPVLEAMVTVLVGVDKAAQIGGGVRDVDELVASGAVHDHAQELPAVDLGSLAPEVHRADGVAELRAHAKAHRATHAHDNLAGLIRDDQVDVGRAQLVGLLIQLGDALLKLSDALNRNLEGVVTGCGGRTHGT